MNLHNLKALARAGLALSVFAFLFVLAPAAHADEFIGSISGEVYDDLNVNGVLNAGEPGIPGVTVDLFNDEDTLTGTTTTDASGDYSFTGLDIGDYGVGDVVPAGYTQTEPSGNYNLSLTEDSPAATGVNFGLAQVPEPSTLPVLIIGLLGLAGVVRYRQLTKIRA